MSVTINGIAFDEAPRSCATCGFFSDGRTEFRQGSEIGHCRLFNENHHGWRTPPRRCEKLLRKAMAYPDGTALGVTYDIGDEDAEEEQ
jgi:hypothetical protein